MWGHDFSLEIQKDGEGRLPTRHPQYPGDDSDLETDDAAKVHSIHDNKVEDLANMPEEDKAWFSQNISDFMVFLKFKNVRASRGVSLSGRPNLSPKYTILALDTPASAFIICL